MNEPQFWRRFTQFVRLLGLWSCVVGGIMCTGAAWDLLQGRRAATSELAPAVVGGLVALAFGIALLRIRPYRPDLGDRPFGTSTARQHQQERAWWTGDRLEDDDTPAS